MYKVTPNQTISEIFWIYSDILMKPCDYRNPIFNTGSSLDGQCKVPCKKSGSWAISPIFWTQDVNWTYIKRSEDVLDAFWTFYVRSIYVLCSGSTVMTENLRYLTFITPLACLSHSSIQPSTLWPITKRSSLIIWDTLRDLVSFSQFKKLGKHPLKSDTFSKVAGC